LKQGADLIGGQAGQKFEHLAGSPLQPAKDGFTPGRVQSLLRRFGAVPDRRARVGVQGGLEARLEQFAKACQVALRAVSRPGNPDSLVTMISSARPRRS